LIARVALAAVAVVVLVWLGVMERDSRLQTRAVAEAGTPPISKALRDIRAARFLNPDTAPDTLLGLLYAVHGQRPRGIATLEHVVRREPDNLFAQGQLYSISRGHDDAVAARALAALRRLDPLDFGGSVSGQR
jgi:hypothetical protein